MCYTQTKIWTTVLAVGFTLNAKSRALIRSPSLANRSQTLFDCVPYPTDYETMHASKPHSAYYREIAAMIKCAPQDCVMVGTEMENDMVPAKRAGMRTFLVTENSESGNAHADWHGSLTDFGKLLESL